MWVDKSHRMRTKTGGQTLKRAAGTKCERHAGSIKSVYTHLHPIGFNMSPLPRTTFSAIRFGVAIKSDQDRDDGRQLFPGGAQKVNKERVAAVTSRGASYREI